MCSADFYVIALNPIRDKLAKQINVEWRLPWSIAGAWCTAGTTRIERNSSRAWTDSSAAWVMSRAEDTHTQLGVSALRKTQMQG